MIWVRNASSAINLFSFVNLVVSELFGLGFLILLSMDRKGKKGSKKCETLFSKQIMLNIGEKL